LVDDRQGSFVVILEMRMMMPKFEIVSSQCLSGQTNVLQDGQIREQVGDLEGSTEAKMGVAVRGHVGDVLAFEHDATAGRFQVPAEQVEERRLSGPVWPDDGVEAVFSNLDIDIVDGDKPSKLFAQVFRSQDDVFCHGVSQS
jgi:hypothetical protein